MNTSSLANTLLIDMGLGQVPPSRSTVKNTEPFTLPAADKNHQPDAPQTAKTDKIPTDAGIPSEPTNEPSKDTSSTVDKQTATDASGQDKPRPKSSEQGLASNAVAAQPAVVQQWLAAYSLIEHGKQGIARKIEPKAGYELAQLLANLKIAESAAGISQTAGADKNKPLAPANNTPAGPKTALNNKATAVVGTEPEAVKLPEKAAASAVIATKNNTDPKLTAEDTSGVSGSKAAPQAGKGQESKAASVDNKTTNSSDGKPVIADKPVVSEGLQKPLLNTNPETIKDKPSDSKPTQTQIGPEKSVPTGPKPAVTQLNTAQQDGNTKAQRSNLPGDSSPAKPNPVQAQVTVQPNKNHGNQPFNNGSDSDAGQQILNDNNLQGRATASAAAAKGPNNAFADNVFTSVGEQIQQSIRSSVQTGARQITIQLNPPELGRVFIRFQEQSDQITGLLEVSKTQTRTEIQQALPQIIQNLADSGIQVKRLEVVLTNRGDQQDHNGQSLAAGQENSSGQHTPANSDLQGNGFGVLGREQWPTNLDSYTGFTEIQEQLVTDGTLNMLI